MALITYFLDPHKAGHTSNSNSRKQKVAKRSSELWCAFSKTVMFRSIGWSIHSVMRPYCRPTQLHARKDMARSYKSFR